MRRQKRNYSWYENENVACENVATAFVHNNHVLALSGYRKARLYRRLSKARGTYDTMVKFYNAPTHDDAAQRIDTIRIAIHRIAKFGTDAIKDDVFTNSADAGLVLLQRKAEEWAAKVPNSVLPHFFDVRKFSSDNYAGTDYGSWSVIRQFFETAILMETWMEGVHSSWSGQNAQWLDRNPNIWLIGEELPRIYQKTFGRGFTLSRNASQELTGPGVQFVLDALAAMQVQSGGKSWAAETVASYVRRARQTA